MALQSAVASLCFFSLLFFCFCGASGPEACADVAPCSPGFECLDSEGKISSSDELPYRGRCYEINQSCAENACPPAQLCTPDDKICSKIVEFVLDEVLIAGSFGAVAKGTLSYKTTPELDDIDDSTGEKEKSGEEEEVLGAEDIGAKQKSGTQDEEVGSENVLSSKNEEIERSLSSEKEIVVKAKTTPVQKSSSQEESISLLPVVVKVPATQVTKMRESALFLFLAERKYMETLVGVDGLIQCVTAGPAQCFELSLPSSKIKAISEHVVNTAPPTNPIVMEFCEKGDLFSDPDDGIFSIGKDTSGLTRVAAMMTLARAVAALHSRHLLHRDIKLENIFMGCPSAAKTGSSVTLADLGLMKKYVTDETDKFGCLLTTEKRQVDPAGTTGYLGPELYITTDKWKADFSAFAEYDSQQNHPILEMTIDDLSKKPLNGCYRAPGSSGDVFALGQLFILLALKGCNMLIMPDKAPLGYFDDEGSYVAQLFEYINNERQKEKTQDFDPLLDKENVRALLVDLLMKMSLWDPSARPSPDEVITQLTRITEALSE